MLKRSIHDKSQFSQSLDFFYYLTYHYLIVNFLVVSFFNGENDEHPSSNVSVYGFQVFARM